MKFILHLFLFTAGVLYAALLFYVLASIAVAATLYIVDMLR